MLEDSTWAYELSITLILDLTPPDAWFHLGVGSKNSILDNRKRGSGQMNNFERLAIRVGC